MDNFDNALDLVHSHSPSHPVFCLRPFAVERAAKWFCDNFPGKIFYTVKANPAPWVLQALIAGGITRFDVASLEEAQQVRVQAPDAKLAFMHPIKSQDAIAEAYFKLGIRIFALDSHAELDKIITATSSARDLTLCVRLKVPGENSKISLNRKFGIAPEHGVVRRQGFWNQCAFKPRESLAHLVDCIMQRTVCDASGAFRASFV